MKTHQATAKRFKITKNKKITHRTCGQGHFNSRDKGDKTMGKRRDRPMAKASHKTINRLVAS